MTLHPKETDRHVKSVLKALAIIEAFESNTQLSLKNLCKITGFPKSGILRLCGTLEAAGYLYRSTETGEYTLGFKFYHLSQALERHHPLAAISRPILQQIARHTGEATSINVIMGFERCCVAYEEGTFPVRYSMDLRGLRMPLFAGAGGKVLLAFGDPELMDSILANHILQKLTDHTITDPDDLKKELDAVREAGFAHSIGERISESSAIAVPVFDKNSQLRAALTLISTTTRFADGGYRQWVDYLKQKGKELSQLLDMP